MQNKGIVKVIAVLLMLVCCFYLSFSFVTRHYESKAAAMGEEAGAEYLDSIIPMSLSGFTPKNYSGEYWGAVTADKALQNSLNAPFVHLLREYGQQRFHSLLRQLGLRGIVFDAEHYGLSLIVGGAEASLYDITNAYARMGRKLASHVNESYDVVVDDGIVPFSAEAIAETFHVMLGLTRPVSQAGWGGFASSRKVAWKTGTSYGFKDAWAVGVTDRYAVGVWVGNADGEGRPGLTGVGAAAPLMFDVIGKLNDDYTYPANTSESIEIEVHKTLLLTIVNLI